MRTRDEIMKGLECCDFEHWQSRKCKQCPYMKADDEWCDSADGVRGDAITYIQQLESQVPKWISVEERLPENDNDVLIMTPTGVSIGYCNIYCGYWADYINDEDDHITHWMPLPEPPKEEERDAQDSTGDSP